MTATPAELYKFLRRDGLIRASTTTNAASISDGDSLDIDITATGAALGDFVLAHSVSIDVTGLGVTAQVTAADTATITLLNNTGGAVDLASATYRVVVAPRGIV